MLFLAKGWSGMLSALSIPCYRKLIYLTKKHHDRFVKMISKYDDLKEFHLKLIDHPIKVPQIPSYTVFSCVGANMKSMLCSGFSESRVCFVSL